MERINKTEESQNTYIKCFNHEQFGEIMTVTTEDGEVLFKANDVARALGYSQPAVAVCKLCKGVTVLETPTQNQYGATIMQSTKFIDEADLYRLVMRSRQPNAVMFQDWVCEEVLPSIRKHGAYMTDVTIEQLLTSPELVIGLATQLKEERELRRGAETRATYADKVLACPDLVDITQIAQDYGMTAIAFNLQLCKLGVQFKDNGQWILYAKYKGRGYTHSQTFHFSGRCRMHTKWTQRGRFFLYDVLRNAGILPLMERCPENESETLKKITA